MAGTWGNGPNRMVLRNVSTTVLRFSQAMGDFQDLLQDAGWPQYATMSAIEASHLYDMAERMSAEARRDRL